MSATWEADIAMLKRERDRLRATIAEQNEKLFYARSTERSLLECENHVEELTRKLTEKTHALGVEQGKRSVLEHVLDRLLCELDRSKARRSPSQLDAIGTAKVTLAKVRGTP